MKTRNPITIVLPWLLVASGLLGLLASFEITIDKFNLLANPNFVPSCSINPVISCGTIMKSAQAAAFGFPNPFIGLIAFTAVVVVGVSLLAGAKFPRWYWLLFNLGSLLGLVFVHWLIFEAVFRIKALCPWCVVAWIVTAATFWYTLLDNLAEGRVKIAQAARPITDFVVRQHWFVLAIWYLAVAGLVLSHFWYYFRTVI